MPSWMAWVQRPSGMGEVKPLLGESTLIKLENVSWKIISIIDLNCYLIPQPGNTKGGSITVPLTSCLTGLESAV